jgi:hypothetical protein
MLDIGAEPVAYQTRVSRRMGLWRPVWQLAENRGIGEIDEIGSKEAGFI